MRGRKRIFTETEGYCPDCKAMLPRSMFTISTTSTRGIQGYCKEHQKTRVAKWNQRKTIKSLLRRAADRRARMSVLEAEAQALEAKVSALQAEI